jgi:dinuclear metal center YbgI/SA1388 family protein
MKRDVLVHYLDEYLGTYAMQDYGENGLQVEGAEDIDLLAFAVDTNRQTIEGAIQAGAGILVVHHGLFWGKPLPIVGPHRKRVQALLMAGCSLYACHLPLDRHPEIGNNVQLARLLGLSVTGGFAETFGFSIGVVAQAPEGMSCADLVQGLGQATGGKPLLLSGGPPEVRRVAILSGGGAGEIPLVAQAGCDTFITGETSHSYYHDAAEYGINVIYGGHYATETVGVRALAVHLSHKFDLPTVFIDRPTGL